MHKKSYYPEIWDLAYPIILLTLAQKTGSIFEGLLLSVNSTRELAVTSICSPYISAVTTVGYGLAISMNVIVAGVYGKKGEKKNTENIMEGAVLIALTLGLVISAVVGFLMYFSFSSMPKERPVAYLFMLPYLLGNPVILLHSMLIAQFRGMGDSRTGMWMTFLAVPIQLVTGYLLYHTCGFTALGYGMLFSRIAGCLYGMRQYRRYGLDLGGWRKVRFSGNMIKEFVKLAVPVSLSKAVGPSANVIINSLLLSMGAQLVAVYGLGNRLSILFCLPAIAVGTAAVTLIAVQKDRRELGYLIRQLCTCSVLPTILLVLTAWSFRETIWQAMTAGSAMGPEGETYWSICLWAYPFVAVEMTMTSVLQALGYGVPTLMITVIRLWGVQIPLSYLAERNGYGAEGAWGAYLASNIVSMLISVIWGMIKIKGGSKNECN